MLSTVEQAPISDLHQEQGVWGDFALTKSSSLIGAIEIDGGDPDGYLKEDFKAISIIARDIYQKLPVNIIISEYMVHVDDCVITLKDRKHPICHALSKRRERFLNQHSLSRSKVIHAFEIKPRENLSKLDVISLFKHFGLSFVNADSRTVIRNHFSNESSVIAYQKDLDTQHTVLDNAISEVIERWSSIFRCRKLSVSGFWAFERFISNLDVNLLDDAVNEKVPTDNWDVLLSDGDRVPVVINEMNCLKLSGVKNQYARVASIVEYGGESVGLGMWSSTPKSPARLKGNYVIMNRYKPLTKWQQSLMFRRSENDLNQASFSVSDILSNNKKTATEKRELLKPKIKEQLEQLEQAQMISDRWYLANSCVVLFDSNPVKLNQSSVEMKSALEGSGFKFVWESAGLSDAWKNYLVGGKDQGIREVPFTASQMGATSLLYKSSEGQRQVPDLNYEEPLYWFQTENGIPFAYNPFVEGRAVVFGIGPIRSGKSFLKNTLATHWLKYGGFLRSLDVDPGSEPIAYCYKGEGGTFTLEADEDGCIKKGFNPFYMAEGENDLIFINHIKNQIMLMLESNDSEDLRTIAAHEQAALDHAIKRTLMLPKDKQRLSSVKNHCPKELQRKLERWCEGGMYGHVFDQKEDSIRTMNQLVGTFNLAAVKRDDILLPLIMSEIFFRVINAFEDPKNRLLPKYFDVDEGHAFLEIPYIAKQFIKQVRTWGKWLGGIGIWSQSPKEYLDLKDWPALRSAASTFFFMADPSMDKALYQETFNFLTDGECEQIKNLIPKKEAYIIQPDLGVSKKIILNVEPEQYVVSTSKPSEAPIFREKLKHYEFEQAQALTIKHLESVEKSKTGDKTYA